ncbi:MAG TPA: SpoIIE family protein phosphatase [Terriglobia bacterium]|nr:SpoIIE family protein phosphatase [Terriglobia bacterium]
MLLESLRNEYRRHRVTRFAIWVAAYGVALWVVGRTTGRVPGLLWLLFWITSVPAAFYYLFRLVGFFKQRVLWSLRRRLIITYLFIAVVPIFLFVLLVGLGAFMINGQFASYLISLRLREQGDELQELDHALVDEARVTSWIKPEELLSHLQRVFETDLNALITRYPGLEITTQVGSTTRAFRLDGGAPPQPVTLPAWLDREEFEGTVVEQGRILLRAVERKKTPSGELTIILSQPFTPEMLDILGTGIGPVGILTPPGSPRAGVPAGSSATVAQPSSAEEDRIPGVRISSKSVQIPQPASIFDFVVFGATSLDPVLWEGKQEHAQADSGRIVVTSRIITLNRQLFSQLGNFSSVLVISFLVIAGFFLIIELFALIVGIQLTRSMTTTVDKLYRATEQVKVGDFSYRINLPAKDQLSALGEAFDGMASSVERLLRESLEKTRLEGELEIAREVQGQLFPQKAPEVPGLQLYGVCKPARVVSGDYYDFLPLGGGRVGLVVGDISGKGISAALLMASVQSALHAQFYDGHAAGDFSQASLVSSAEVVGRLNRQLFASTPTEKYATFFYAVYDGETRRLIYTNAGHPPPYYFHRGKISRLVEGGTVVGLFEEAIYEQAVIQLEPGDVLLAFTDGITEPENSYGEEFGEGRLFDVAQRASICPPEELVEVIYRAVSDWTGSPDLQDDMTLMVARCVV